MSNGQLHSDNFFASSSSRLDAIALDHEQSKSMGIESDAFDSIDRVVDIASKAAKFISANNNENDKFNLSDIISEALMFNSTVSNMTTSSFNDNPKSSNLTENNKLTNVNSTATSANDDQANDEINPMMEYVLQIMVGLHLIVFISGLVGNTLVCLSVYRNKSLQTVTNYFIVNLAVADFLVILICLPPTVYWDVYLTWSFGLASCKLVTYLQVSSCLFLSIPKSPTNVPIQLMTSATKLCQSFSFLVVS